MKTSKLAVLFLLVLIAVLPAGRAQPGPWGFNTYTNSTSSPNAQGFLYNIAAGNLDGSGRTTVVSANDTHSALSVFTNDGAGNLHWSYDYHPPNCVDPWGITLATNLLGDGKVAVVYADGGDDNLTILTNSLVTGLGVYQQLSAGIGSFFVNVVSNLVGDGRFALVAQNYDGNTLTVFTNNGAGRFGQFALINSGRQPYGLSAGDFYHTGRPVLACANYSDKSLTIYSYQSASPHFITNATYALPDYPNNVSAVSNLVGDHLFSLAVVLQTNVLILTNNGAGPFGSNAVLNVDFGSGNVAGYVTAADLYGRGHLDLVVSPYESAPTLVVFTNTGAGRFNVCQTLANGSPSQALVASLDGTTNLAIIAGDDSPKLDIWRQVTPPPAPLAWDALTPFFYGAPLTASQLNAYSFDSATISFIPGTFTYSPTNGTVLPAGTNVLTVLFTPFAYTNYSPATTQVEQVVISPDRIQTGPWGYNTLTASTTTTNDQYNMYNIAAGNLDGSGRTTVVSANFGYGALSVFTNDGVGNLNWSYDYYPPNCSEPWGIVMATNLLGDGKVAVVYVDVSEYNLTILTNSPVTGLGIYQQLPTGSDPYFLTVVSNLVGDARFSLVAQNYNDSTLTVFTNNGAGIFGQFGLINSGNGPFGLAAGDFYHTGRPALACANNGDNTLTIYSYQGASARFITNATYALPDSPNNVSAVSNLLGDHQFSLAVVLQTNVLILTNNGSGSFGSNASLNVDVGSGDVAGYVTAADLYGRSHLDLVVSPYEYGTNVVVFTNTGTGRFNFSQTLAGYYASQAVVASLNGTTNLSIIAGSSSPALNIWSPVAPPPPPVTWTAPTPIFYGAPLTASQLDAHSSVPGTYTYTPANGTVLPVGTNLLTVLFTPFAYTNYSPVTTQVELVVISPDRIQPGPWGYNTLTYSTASTNDQYYLYTIAAGNLDGSGRTTVVSANNGYGALSVFTNDGMGNLNWSYDFSPANCSEPYAITMATNLLGDGKVTVVYVDEDKYNLTILTNNPVTGLGVYQQLPAGNLPNSLVVVSNLLGDGRFSLVTGNFDDNTLTVYTNNGAGKFGQFGLIHSGNQPYGLAAGDFYHTGRPALACANIGGKSVTIYSYQGLSSGFITNATYAMPALAYNVSAVSNLFGDHQFALAVALPTEVLILTNNGSGTFGSNATLDASLVASPGFVTAADLYGRGHQDLVVSPYEYGAAVQVFTNTGTGSFNLSQTLTGIYPSQAVVASLTGGTSLAIIAGSYEQYLNIWSQVAPPPAPLTWTNPSAIIYPTALSSVQLNATSSVPGTFTYTPASGTVLPVGTHVLTTVFSPADAIDYNSVTTNVTINVLPFQILSFYVAHDRNFTLNFNAGLGWIVEASTNLEQWLPLQTNDPATTFPYQFIDYESTNHPWRFYRILVP